MTIKGRCLKVKIKIISNAPKLESKEIGKFKQTFSEIQLDSTKIIFFLLQAIAFLQSLKIQIIISQHVKYEHLSPEGKKMGAERKLSLKINIFFNVFFRISLFFKFERCMKKVGFLIQQLLFNLYITKTPIFSEKMPHFTSFKS